MVLIITKLIIRDKMALLNDYYLKIKNKIESITKLKYFDEIYAGIIALIALFGWGVSTNVGMCLLIILGILAIFFLMDLKYVIPQVVYFIFTISEGFLSDQFPIAIIVLGTVFAIFLIAFTIKNGIHLSKMKSFIGLAGFAVMNFIPIFWSSIPKGNEVFYFLFFANIGYLALYVVMVNGIGKNSLNLLSVTMSYLAVLLAFECIITAISLLHTVESIFDLWYYIGWGLCNEAGLLMCTSIPFTFYLIGKSKNLKQMIFQLGKVGITLIGLFMTMSRGNYLFGFGLVGLLAISLLFLAENRKTYKIVFITIVSLALVVVLALSFKLIPIFMRMLESVFKEGFDSNGRYDFWVLGADKWNDSALTMLLGPGFCCVITTRVTALGDQIAPLVFHSTFVQTLCMGGILGVISLIIHFYQKYTNLFKLDKLFMITIGIGYLIVDIYGMIDNTYHMYYYMLPLMVILACVDTSHIYDNNFLDINVTS